MRFQPPELVQCTLEHIREIVPKLRPMDLAECEALGLYGPELLESLEDARQRDPADTWALLDDDGAVVAIGGVNRHAGDTGVVWAMGTEWIADNPVAFTKVAEGLLRDWRGRFRLLTNIILSENRTVLKWLEALGFQVTGPQPYGPDGTLYHTFRMNGDPV